MIKYFFPLILFLPLFSLEVQNIDVLLEKAYADYRKGELSQEIEFRQKAFNQALESYLTIEKSIQGKSPKLYYNIANCYHQLSEPAWALVYYARAQHFLPRNEKVAHNRSLVEKKLAIKSRGDFHILSWIFLHDFLSLSERSQLVSFFYVLSIFFASLFLWCSFKLLKPFLALSLCLLVFFFFSTLYSDRICSKEAFIISPTILHLDAGIEYVGKDKPLLDGEKVTLLDTVSQKNWWKVKTRRGKVGYLPKKVVCKIHNANKQSQM